MRLENYNLMKTTTDESQCRDTRKGFFTVFSQLSSTKNFKVLPKYLELTTRAEFRRATFEAAKFQGAEFR